MNRLLLILVALSLGLSSRAADLSASTNVDYVTSYVFRGAKLASDSLQPSVNLGYGDAYATVWGSTPVRNARLQETDLTLGTALLGLDVGVTAYTYPDAPSTWEPYLGKTLDLGHFNLGGYAFYDARLRVTTFEARSTVTLLDVKPLKVGVDAVVGTSNGRGVPSYAYWSISPNVKLTLSEKLSVGAAIQYVSSSSDEVGRDQWVGRLSVGYSF